MLKKTAELIKRDIPKPVHCTVQCQTFKDPLEKYPRKRVGKLGGTGSYGKGGSRSSRCQNPISTLLANRHHQVSKNNLEYSYQDFEIWKALWFKLQTDKIDLS